MSVLHKEPSRHPNCFMDLSSFLSFFLSFLLSFFLSFFKKKKKKKNRTKENLFPAFVGLFPRQTEKKKKI